MDATALVCDEQQRFTLERVVLPDPGDDQVALRTHYSGVSIGTEFALIRGKLSWGPYPLCTGYMGTGTVEAAGPGVTGLRVGDVVYFRRNDRMAGADGGAISCVSGTHCSRAVLKPDTTHGAERLPDGVPLDVASTFVMPAVGLYGVDMAGPAMGSTVVVYGVGLIGLGVVAACAHRGCVVVAVDLDPRRLEVARELGADHLLHAGAEDVPAGVRAVAPAGADTVFECTGLPECLNEAIEVCRPHGMFVWQGNYGAEPVRFRFLPPHGRRLRMCFPCDDGLQPCRRAVLKNMAMGVLRWERTITHRIEHTDAPGVFGRILRGQAQDVLGAVIHWGD